MDAATLRQFLGRGVVAHYAILLAWFGVFVFTRGGLYRRRLHAGARGRS